MSLLIILSGILIIIIFAVIVYRKKQQDKNEIDEEKSPNKCVYSPWSSCDCKTRRITRSVIYGDKTCIDTIRSCKPDPKLCCEYSDYGECDCNTKKKTRLLIKGDPELCFDTESDCEPSPDVCCRYTQFKVCDCATNTKTRELKEGSAELCTEDLVKPCDPSEYETYCCEYTNWSKSCTCNTNRQYRSLVKGDTSLCNSPLLKFCPLDMYKKECCEYGNLTPSDSCPCGGKKKRMLTKGLESNCGPFITEDCQNTPEELLKCSITPAPTLAPTLAPTPIPTPDIYKVEGLWDSYKKDGYYAYDYGPVTLSYVGKNEDGDRIYNLSGEKINNLEDKYKSLKMNTSDSYFYFSKQHIGTATYTSRGKPINITDNYSFFLTRY
jgi:hypothetical protein